MIKIIRLGHYHPSNTNWSYSIWLVITQLGATFYRDTFGGNYRMIEKMKEKGYEVTEIFLERAARADFKWSDVKQMPDLENYTND